VRQSLPSCYKGVKLPEDSFLSPSVSVILPSNPKRSP